jgi:hypothetical protein
MPSLLSKHPRNKVSVLGKHPWNMASSPLGKHLVGLAKLLGEKHLKKMLHNGLSFP